jgi:hypothetical protein
MRMGVVFAAAALTVTAGVAGCGGSAGSPQALPSLSPAASASPSPSPVPSGIQAPTAQGAADFVRFFYAQIGQAFLTKNPDLIARLSTPGCQSCQTFVASVTRLRDRDEHVDRFAIHVRFAVAGPVTNGRASVDAGWDADAVTRFDASNKVISVEPGLAGVEEHLELQRSGETWRVMQYKRIRVRG